MKRCITNATVYFQLLSLILVTAVISLVLCACKSLDKQIEKPLTIEDRLINHIVESNSGAVLLGDLTVISTAKAKDSTYILVSFAANEPLLALYSAVLNETTDSSSSSSVSSSNTDSSNSSEISEVEYTFTMVASGRFAENKGISINMVYLKDGAIAFGTFSNRFTPKGEVKPKPLYGDKLQIKTASGKVYSTAMADKKGYILLIDSDIDDFSVIDKAKNISLNLANFGGTINVPSRY